MIWCLNNTECFAYFIYILNTASQLCKLWLIFDHCERLLCSQLIFEMQKLQNLNPVALHLMIGVNFRQTVKFFRKQMTVHCYFCHYTTINKITEPPLWQ